MTLSVNAIYAADCSLVLDRIADAQATLIYLDPPWFVQQSHRLENHSAQNELRTYFEFHGRILQQCERILAPDGNLFFHCEPLLLGRFLLLLDQVFRGNFRAEYVLPRIAPSDLPTRHDVILRYSKTSSFVDHALRVPLPEEELNKRYRSRDERGKYRFVELTTAASVSRYQFEWKGHTPGAGRSWRYPLDTLDRLEAEGLIVQANPESKPRLKQYLDDAAGLQLGTIWDDIFPERRSSSERVRFPAQQPLALLDRIVAIGSNPGDLVVDPFSGSGTALVAAQGAGRRWIGCDTDSAAYQCAVARLERESELHAGTDFAKGNGSDLQQIPAQPTFYRPLITLIDDSDQASLVIAGGENDWVEFKVAAAWNSITGRPESGMREKVVRAVAAFLNKADGGTVVIGVDDDGLVAGLAEDFLAANKQAPGRDTYELWLRDILAHGLGAEFSPYVKITFDTVQGTEVCLIRVAPAHKPCFVDEQLFLRAGNHTRKLTVREAIDYTRRRWP